MAALHVNKTDRLNNYKIKAPSSRLHMITTLGVILRENHQGLTIPVWPLVNINTSF